MYKLKNIEIIAAFCKVTLKIFAFFPDKDPTLLGNTIYTIQYIIWCALAQYSNTTRTYCLEYCFMYCSMFRN